MSQSFQRHTGQKAKKEAHQQDPRRWRNVLVDSSVPLFQPHLNVVIYSPHSQSLKRGWRWVGKELAVLAHPSRSRPIYTILLSGSILSSHDGRHPNMTPFITFLSPSRCVHVIWRYNGLHLFPTLFCWWHNYPAENDSCSSALLNGKTVSRVGTRSTYSGGKWPP